MAKSAPDLGTVGLNDQEWANVAKSGQTKKWLRRRQNGAKRAKKGGPKMAKKHQEWHRTGKNIPKKMAQNGQMWQTG